jgi:hypothetical protein
MGGEAESIGKEFKFLLRGGGSIIWYSVTALCIYSANTRP